MVFLSDWDATDSSKMCQATMYVYTLYVYSVSWHTMEEPVLSTYAISTPFTYTGWPVSRQIRTLITCVLTDKHTKVEGVAASSILC